MESQRLAGLNGAIFDMTKVEDRPGDIPEDSVGMVSSEDKERFELVCAELANENTRKILKAISGGINTCSDIARSVGLSVQSTSDHLAKLKEAGIIEASGSIMSSLRGRTATSYSISKIAIVLVPSEIFNSSTLREIIRAKAMKALKKRILISITVAVAWAAGLAAVVYLDWWAMISGLSYGSKSYSANYLDKMVGFFLTHPILFIFSLTIPAFALFVVAWKLPRKKSIR